MPVGRLGARSSSAFTEHELEYLIDEADRVQRINGAERILNLGRTKCGVLVVDHRFVGLFFFRWFGDVVHNVPATLEFTEQREQPFPKEIASLLGIHQVAAREREE